MKLCKDFSDLVEILVLNGNKQIFRLVFNFKVVLNEVLLNAIIDLMGVEVVVKVSVIGVVFPIFMAKNVVKVGVIFNSKGIFSVNGDFESIVLITVIFV